MSGSCNKDINSVIEAGCLLLEIVLFSAVYMQNALKLYSRLVLELRGVGNESEDTEAVDDNEAALELTRLVSTRLAQFTHSPDMEVQERACVALQILKYLEKYMEKEGADAEVVKDFSLLFSEDLNPVAPRAQRKVGVVNATCREWGSFCGNWAEL